MRPRASRGTPTRARVAPASFLVFDRRLAYVCVVCCAASGLGSCYFYKSIVFDADGTDAADYQFFDNKPGRGRAERRQVAKE